ncbi:MAG: hypothetical protein KAS66_05145 [Candidatus Omnitrophica bacterium]|nr:hypothetical protein [Candidatus Omnitrophota bacterium]
MVKWNSDYNFHTEYQFTMPIMVEGGMITEVEMKCILIVNGPHDDLYIDHAEEIEVEGWVEGKPRVEAYVYNSAPRWLKEMAEKYLDAEGKDDAVEHIYERYTEDRGN